MKPPAPRGKRVRKKRVQAPDDWKGPKYREVNDKPPWHARSERDHIWMRDWVGSRLFDIARSDEEPGSATSEDVSALMADAKQWREYGSEALAIKAAREYGDIEPLRRMYPSIAEFINLPARKDRSNYKKRPDHSPDGRRKRLKLAIAEAELIRDIWQEHYGRRNRPSGPSTATAITASRHGVSEDEIIKKRPKKR